MFLLLTWPPLGTGKRQPPAKRSRTHAGEPLIPSVAPALAPVPLIGLRPRAIGGRLVQRQRGFWTEGVPYAALIAFGLNAPGACALEAQPADPATGGAGSTSKGGSSATGGSNAEDGGDPGSVDGGTSSGGAGALGGSRNDAGRGATGGSSTGGTTGEGGTPDTGGAGGTGGSGGQVGGTGGASETGGTGGDSTTAGTGGSVGGASAGAGGMPPVCTACGVECVFLETDEANCGACGYACVNGRECVAGRCTPEWQPISTVGAPAARSGHAGAFLDGRFYVFGGSLTWDGPRVATAGAYDPVTDRWFSAAPLVAARTQHMAVSTGTEIYTFGGFQVHLDPASLAGLERFVPDSGQGAWTTVTASGQPDSRYLFGMAWTGSHVMIFGGHNGNLPGQPTGGLFDPVTSTWSDATCALTDCNRVQGVLFRDGSAMRFMGGELNYDYPNWTGNVGTATSGLSFYPANNSWSTWPHPDGTTWFGGIAVDDGRRIYFPRGGGYIAIYDRRTGWLPNDFATPPAGLCETGAAYASTGTELIAWSGACGNGETNVGGRYQPPAPP
jgi:hypothetical protein